MSSKLLVLLEAAFEALRPTSPGSRPWFGHLVPEELRLDPAGSRHDSYRITVSPLSLLDLRFASREPCSSARPLLQPLGV